SGGGSAVSPWSQLGLSLTFFDQCNAVFGVNSRGDTNRQGFVALDEAGIHPLGLVDHLNLVEALEDFFPDDLQLQLGKTHADAAMDAEAERQMRARPRAIDD